MDEWMRLSGLGALGFEMPSPAYLMGALVFSLVGWVAFRRGRKLERAELTWGGVAMMFYPYFISETVWLWGVGAAFCLWIYCKWN